MHAEDRSVRMHLKLLISVLQLLSLPYLNVPEHDVPDNLMFYIRSLICKNGF